MQSVNSSSPTFGANRLGPAQAVARTPHFGEGPIKAVDDVLEREAKELKANGPGFAKRMAVPTAWVVGGALLAFGTAGILHFIGFPLMAWGAYQAVKKWKA